MRLHQARAEYAAPCRTLPWSVEPVAGWPGEVHPHTGVVTGGRDASPGYTPEQAAEEKRLSITERLEKQRTVLAWLQYQVAQTRQTIQRLEAEEKEQERRRAVARREMS